MNNNPKTPQKMEEAPKNPFSLVLNGGKDEMENATIPVKWVFEESFFKEKRPTHLLFIERSAKEMSHCQSSNNGRRYIVPVENLVEHFEILSSGRHSFKVFAFKVTLKDELDSIKQYLGRNGDIYDRAIYDDVSVFRQSLAHTSAEFIVPKELFAPKPTSSIGKAWWKYLNWPLKNTPVDECKMRAKILWGIPKSPFFLVWQIIKLFFFLLYSVYLVVAPFFSFFFGFCPQTPKQIIATLKAVFKSHKALTLNVIYEKVYRSEYVKYKEWWRRDQNGNDHKKKLLMAPWEVILFLPFVFSVCYYVGGIFSSLGAASLFFGTSIPFLVVLVIWGWRASDIGSKIDTVIGVSFFSFFSVLSVLATIAFICFLPLHKQPLFDLLVVFVVIFWIVSIVLLIFLIVQVVQLIAKRFKKASSFFMFLIKPALFLYNLSLAKIIVYVKKQIKAYQESPATQAKRKQRQKDKMEKVDQEYKKDEEERQKLRERMKIKQEKRDKFLQTVTQEVKRVDLKELPSPQTAKDAVKRFRVGFWALKARVCRPYDQEN